MVSARGECTLQGVLAMSGDIFGCHSSGGTIAISWLEARGGAEPLTMHRTDPTAEDYLRLGILV